MVSCDEVARSREKEKNCRLREELQIKRKGDKSSFSGDSSLGRKAAITTGG